MVSHRSIKQRNKTQEAENRITKVHDPLVKSRRAILHVNTTDQLTQFVDYYRVHLRNAFTTGLKDAGVRWPK